MPAPLQTFLKPWLDLPPTLRARIGQVAGVVVSVLFLVLAVRLLQRELRPEVLRQIPAAMAALSWWQVAGAVVVSLLVHLWLGAFDVLGLKTLGVPVVAREKNLEAAANGSDAGVPAARAVRTGFIAYTFVHNIGLSALTGNVIRMKRYARFGVKPATVAKLFVCLIATMWLGFTVAFGISIVVKPTGLLPMSAGLERALGAAMIALVAFYVALCFIAPKLGRRFTCADAVLKLPAGRHALAQVAMGTINWLASASVLWLLLPASAAYGDVLAALCMVQVVVIASHVPGGVGVLEGTLLVLLGDRVDAAGLATGVLLFRAIYFLMPFMISLLTLAGEQIAARWRRRRPRTPVVDDDRRHLHDGSGAVLAAAR
ncbi:MAG TPA: hypothetical protein VGF99_04835 [Myxococcota bacterium]